MWFPTMELMHLPTLPYTAHLETLRQSETQTCFFLRCFQVEGLSPYQCMDTWHGFWIEAKQKLLKHEIIRLQRNLVNKSIMEAPSDCRLPRQPHITFPCLIANLSNHIYYNFNVRLYMLSGGNGCQCLKNCWRALYFMMDNVRELQECIMHGSREVLKSSSWSLSACLGDTELLLL